MRTTIENAQKILAVLESGFSLKTIRNLAREAGFQNASSRAFKDAFNYLITEGVLKLHKSGWSSEKGISNRHLDGVILASDIYVYNGEAETKDGGIEKILTFPVEGSWLMSARQKNKVNPCSKCSEYDASGFYGLCKKYNWLIEKKLANDQRLCSC